MTDLISITISQLRQAVGYQDGGDNNVILISADKSTESDLFRYPLRLDAVVIALCTEGEGRVMINLKESVITPNMMVVNLPENIIRIDRVSDNFRGYVLIVSQHFLREAQIDLNNMISVYMHIKNHPSRTITPALSQHLQKFYHLIQECIEDDQGAFRNEILKGLIRAFLYKCAEQLQNLTHDEERSVKSRREVFFRQFIELLTQYHREQRSVGFYAEKMHITPKYMSSLMKEITGRSAAEWIDEYVILEAKTLLKYSGLSIQEVAYKLNFSTQSFFGKYFKQHTGMSPGQYKMQ